MTARPVPANGDDLTTGQIIAFGALVWPLVIGNQSISFLLPYYSQVIGLPLAVIGLILTWGRVFDAFWDTGIAYISDNTTGRWGRRRPWIVLGMILFVPAVWLLFVPGRDATVLQFGIGVFLFFFAWTMAYIPILSLATELTRDNVKRNAITLSQGVAANSALVIGAVVPLFLLDQSMAGLRGAVADFLATVGLAIPAIIEPLRAAVITGPERLGKIMLVMVWMTSIALPVTLVAYLIKVREQPVSTKAAKGSVTAALRNRVFQRFFVGYGLMMLGYMGRLGLMPFVIGFVFKDLDALLLLLLVQNVTAIAATPIWARVMRKYERVKIVIISAIIEASGLLLLAVIGAEQHGLMYFAFFLMGVPGLTIMLVPYQIAGDCADYAKWKTRTESRAVHVSLISLSKKTGAIWNAGSVGLVAWLGFNPKLAEATPEGIALLKGFGLYFPAAVLLIGCVLVAGFPITRRRQRALQRRLDLRARVAEAQAPPVALAEAARLAGNPA
jgi:glycoside/pentoside/hexuronide:cation symporter, GPH family